jgi:hypothetical protein
MYTEPVTYVCLVGSAAQTSKQLQPVFAREDKPAQALEGNRIFAVSHLCFHFLFLFMAKFLIIKLY